MYGKIFDTIYDGSLHGEWEAIATMQLLVTLCDADGVIDMTPKAIAARTSFPLEIIEKGLAVLASPDPDTRTPGEEGRRIVPLDQARRWGWRLVNHEYYRNLASEAQKRALAAERKRRQRERQQRNDGENTDSAAGDSDNQRPDVTPLSRTVTHVTPYRYKIQIQIKTQTGQLTLTGP